MENNNSTLSSKPLPERETLDEKLPTLNRRKFFKLMGSGLAVAFIFQDVLSLAGQDRVTTAIPANQVAAWIHIGEDGIVTVYTGKAEVGQNIRTSLAQAVAEELHVSFSSIKMIMGDTELVPYDAGTFGSRSTPQMGTQLRKAAATARQSLIEMAAKNWNADSTTLKAEDGFIIHAESAKKISYGELINRQELLLPINEKIALTPAEEWKIAGKTINKSGGKSFITGSHQYASDIRLPGMVYGKILRPPFYEATIISVDTSKAEAMSGVKVIRQGDVIGVVANSVYLAAKAVQCINAKWNPVQKPSRADIFQYLVKNASGEQGRGGSQHGNLEEGMAAADLRHTATYNINYIAHVPLEPRAAVAEWKEDKLTVWTGTQRPFGVQQDLAEHFSIPKEKVRVIMPDTGSAYGGKHSGEAAIEAAILARAAGKPVKLVWTREEEFTCAYFRPGGVIDVSSGVKKNGDITAWKFHNYNSGPSAMETQYRIANQEIAHHPSNSPFKQGSYRGLAATANVFARESHIADLARLIGMEQLEFRMRNLDNDRLKAVLQAAAKSFGWDANKKPASHGYGISCAFEKGGYVAACVEVMITPRREVKVIRVSQAFECGAIVNPLHLENQVMGSIIQGMGGALFEYIDFADNKILNPHLSAYRVPRFRDVPAIDIITLDRKDLPSAGAGEAAILCIAPAIRNAILDASNIELNHLPMLPNGRLPETQKPV